ncbi:LLM class flavin-dependent oxidoreductase [Uniformispora flossi]|uniref:LLM class flavin-dependent oxidoreductase n=1 Tax=Uniformispora flossi TaxID=3390723 RepID=UPI003C2EEAE4
MEFGIFIQGYVPKSAQEADPLAEHRAIMGEIELVKAADAAGFKYVWVTEHHFLDEYSHISANDVVLGYLAHATERIHLGSGIFNPLPKVNHPAKVAERVAMLDHLSGGRFEFGTGRGAGSHEILGFHPGMTDMGGTRPIWEETIAEFPKMWLQDEYEGFEGEYWSLPPRKILPKPFAKPHPPMWYAAGNTSSYAMAARKGLGVLGFSVGSPKELEPVLTAYKTEIANAEPIGAFVNDNIMVTSSAICFEDRERAREVMMRPANTYLQSLVFRYHDTFPHPPQVPAWPELIPDPDPAAVDWMLSEGMTIAGDPDDVLRQCKRWESTGVDQLTFGLPVGQTIDEALESIRLIGEHVIPKIDTDPVHRTTRFRDAAAGGGNSAG